jgi:hypothetical protein
MKFLAALTILITLYSCGGTTSQTKKSFTLNENWDLETHTFTVNTYTSTGLLDTSYETMLSNNVAGMPIDTIKSIIVRTYKDNKLTNEKGFTLEIDGSKILSNETINKYDNKGNLISEIKMIRGDIFMKSTNEYNNKGQKVKSLILFQKIKEIPNDYNLDSVVAHRNDKKPVQFDTTISNYDYDNYGNLIRAIVSNTRKQILWISISEYSGNEQTFSYDITPQGDTSAKYTFKHEGDLLSRIGEMKELNTVDTTWFDKGKIVKSIGRHEKRKYKNEISYNEKGDEIEKISYK